MKKILLLILAMACAAAVAHSAPSSLGLMEGSDKYLASHSFTQNGTTVHIERVAPGTGAMTMVENASLQDINATGLYPTTPIDCSGLARIALRATIDQSEENATFRVVFYDVAGDLIGISESITLVFPAREYVVYNDALTSVYTWSNATNYILSDKVVSTTSTDNGYWWNCTGQGTSGAAEPTWNATGNSTDGTVTWTSMGQAAFIAEVPNPVANEIGAASFQILIRTAPTGSAKLSFEYGVL